MAYTRLTAAEAAAMIKDQDNIGLSGFTPNGVPKATFRELSKRAIAEHEAGRPFQVGILTGASTSQSIEGDMAAANAIKFRAPFSTNKDFRTHTNMGESAPRLLWRDRPCHHRGFRPGGGRNYLQGFPHIGWRHRAHHRASRQKGAHREEFIP